MGALEEYFQGLKDIRSSGASVPEISYYNPLANLLDDVGKLLKPRVQTILQLGNRGAGFPDGGLFTKEQLNAKDLGKPLMGQPPSRGVIEVKPTSDDAWVTAESNQVTNYWNKYRQVLVTNYRDFVLVGQDDQGKPVKLESYRLAASEAEFWNKVAHPRAFANEHEVPFTEYLSRIMLHGAPVASPQEVAWFLASYARTAMARVEAKEAPALNALRSALEEALGLRFEGTKGDQFFRSTLVQTLFYGVFSSWVLWPKDHPPASKERFDWRTAAWTLRVPMIRDLFEQIATTSKLGALDLVDVLDWAATVLNRVDRPSFFAQFDQGQAVQYFYEPFLAAFDPQLRKDLGVWYTPPEIVRYMVERVDTVLREELDLPDGLADPNVYVLDLGNGTGSYLVEVLSRIADTLKAKGGGALVASDLKQAAMTRIFGFEILPASFVVAHLQLGLLLQNKGAPLDDQGQERVGVYLTNALTGWEPMDSEKEKAFQGMLTGFPELLNERVSASGVKQNKPILVILGNPPYNAFAGVSPEEEAGLVEPYKENLNVPVEQGGWGIKKFNLDELYVRFFRLAERRIAEQTGKGVVCYISNFSYLSDKSFVVMRERLLEGFDKFWFDCMNGDSRETGKRTPEGDPDPSVFSTEFNKAGIRVGTTVGLMVRKAIRDDQPTVRFRHFWGVNKRAELLATARANDIDTQYISTSPGPDNRYSFRPMSVTEDYSEWPKLSELCGVLPINGLMEKRSGALIDVEKSALEDRMRIYYDADETWETVAALNTGLTKDAARFNAKNARNKVLAVEEFAQGRVRKYAIRPFDSRWCYYSGVRPLWNEPRPALWQQCWEGNAFLIGRPAGVAVPEGIPVSFTTCLGDNDYQRGHSYYFPLWLRASLAVGKSETENQGAFQIAAETPGIEILANLSYSARQYLESLGINKPDADLNTASLVWMHSLAIGCSPAYLEENADGIRQDWPRIPLPKTKQALYTSANLGRQVAACLDTEHSVPGVTAGDILPELRAVGVVSREAGGQLKDSELAVTAGWGHKGQNNVVMPGKGKVVQRDYTPEEREAMQEGAERLGMSLDEILACLGEQTCDVYLNDQAYWSNVPSGVWDYVIGGYQVMKKWLSYREEPLLDRPLTNAEVHEVEEMARRIAAILLLQPALDANYQEVKTEAYQWPAA